ncbi:hypothetical protein TPHA_0G02390 [Tetrapisispora phaffii CBS 4417]|uniref:Mitochondrial intermediate peptidase n=1 Tax=Tetrapisispora phaffii (strain ATCC 24235 / CBS 4417 / NBRC 1672 / NRRL Y-8282 / UCD 70-5) TaxID=1071381 RepID=G8BVZ6_TETPH|nr:hypothetical protein TPHA_0G02390 [Tetrapisispora phaffii CBS 4417]CCE64074.1 hypothetical protein TPHA_0G02390 [Tetrapisispora phaffii CBS 4417]
MRQSVTLFRYCRNTIQNSHHIEVYRSSLRYFSSITHDSHKYNSNSSKSSKEVLRKAFDDMDFWTDLNKHNYKVVKKKNLFRFDFSTNNDRDSEKNTGLFNNPYLTSPGGLKTFCQHSLMKANGIVEQLKKDTTEEGLALYISRLDLLSDTLCRVIDLCEFIRSAHPDDEYLKVSQECYELMFEFMNTLNTDVQLCYTLKHILEDEKICSKLTDEEYKVGKILLEDFEKSGIYMEPNTREKFIELSQEISLVGQEFISNTDYVTKNNILIDRESLNLSELELPFTYQLKTDITGKHYKIPTTGPIPYSILTNCSNETIRKKIWTELHSCSQEQIERLKKMVTLRYKLAKLLKKKSFAEYQLQGKMAKNPEEVKKFISTLLDFTKPLAIKELTSLAEVKAADLGLAFKNDSNFIVNLIRPWDRNYYSKINRYENKQTMEDLNELPYYFSLGNVIAGLSNLFHNIYGIRFELAVPKLEETWLPEVRKLNVISESEGLIGIVYCDLFERPSKKTNAAHFTICCSREIGKGEDISTMQVGMNSKGNMFQLPIISLICNFSKSHLFEENGPCFLQLHEIETLFHEMGHAMHSVLGRTRLQNTSGTRCATDFVELPSILMEHFAKDVRVMESISSHYISQEPASPELLQTWLHSTDNLQNLELYTQAKMSMLDQILHSNEIFEDQKDINVVKSYNDLEKKLELFSDDQSNWCGKFGHLFGYGASYYSYLFDRAIASKVWESLFKQNPFSRTSGLKFKDSVLRWGGSRDPWLCIANTLNEPQLAKGDSEAMKYIGSTKILDNS